VSVIGCAGVIAMNDEVTSLRVLDRLGELWWRWGELWVEKSFETWIEG
jgi:hypothetical protein